MLKIPAHGMMGLSLVLLLAAAAGAQDRQFPAALGAGIPSLSGSSPRTGPRAGANAAHPMRPRNSNGGFPIYWGGYDYVYPDAGYQATPPVTNVVMFQAPAAPAAPPAPIRSSIQVIKPETPDAAPDANNEAPTFFVIALRDGRKLSAAAVWVQQNELHYVDADNANGRVPLSAVDRTATRELNQERHLNLRLPAAQ
jgi:hypothetical protein